MGGNASKRVVFLCSGGGGNLSFIQHSIERSWLSNAEIVGVLTDRYCPANDLSNHKGLYNQVIDFKQEDQGNLLSELDNLEPDLIITTFHRVISAAVVERFEKKLINLHYSLLPAFSGLIGVKPVQLALEYRALFSGVTVHMVNENVDAGRPLTQAVIALKQDETVDDIMPVVFRCGCIALLSTVISMLSSRDYLVHPITLDLLGYTCHFNISGAIPVGIETDEQFWGDVQDAIPHSVVVSNELPRKS